MNQSWLYQANVKHNKLFLLPNCFKWHHMFLLYSYIAIWIALLSTVNFSKHPYLLLINLHHCEGWRRLEEVSVKDYMTSMRIAGSIGLKGNTTHVIKWKQLLEKSLKLAWTYSVLTHNSFMVEEWGAFLCIVNLKNYTMYIEYEF